MTSTYTPHKFTKAFPPHVYYVVTLPVKLVKLGVIFLLLLFTGKVTAEIRRGGEMFDRFVNTPW